MQELVLNNPDLSEDERRVILDVIERNKELERRHQKKIEPLKNEIRKIELNSLDIPTFHKNTLQLCIRCRSEFGYFNRPTFCTYCGYKVCENCRRNADTASSLIINATKIKWLCIYCYKIREFMGESGEWMAINKKLKNSSNFSSNTNPKPNNTLTTRNLIGTDSSSKSTLCTDLRQKNESLEYASSTTCDDMLYVRQKIIQLGDKIEFTVTGIGENFKQDLADKLNTSRNSNNNATNLKDSSLRISAHDENLTDLVSLTSSEPDLHSLVLNQSQLLNESSINLQQFNTQINKSISNNSINERNSSSKLNISNNSSKSRNANTNTNANTNGNNSYTVEVKEDSVPNVKETSETGMVQKWKNALIALTSRDNKSEIEMEPVEARQLRSNSKTSAKSRTAHSTPLVLQKKYNKPVGSPILPRVSVDDNDKFNLSRDYFESSFISKKQTHTSFNARQSPTPSRTTFRSDNYTDPDIDAAFADSSLQKFNFSKNHNESINTTASSFNNSDSNVNVRGRIILKLAFNKTTSNLNVDVLRCENLAVANTKKGTSNPYVKLYLLPDNDKKNKRKTSVKKNNINPTFNETLRYTIPANKLASYTLLAAVYHHSVGHNKFLGEARIHLNEDVFKLDRIEQPFDLKKHDLAATKISFELAFIDGNGKDQDGKGILQLHVKNVINLEPRKFNGLTDSFLEVFLLPGRMKSVKQRSRVVKNNLYPEYEKLFIWSNVSLEELKSRSLEISVWSDDFLHANQMLGGIRLNCGSYEYNGQRVEWMDSNITESSIWTQLIQNKNKTVSAQIDLRSEILLHKC